MKNLLAGAALSLSLGLASNTARASVTYDFTASSSFALDGETFSGSFSATLPGFVTSAQYAPAADVTSCTVVDSDGPATCLAPHFMYDLYQNDETIGFHVNSAANPDAEIYYYFSPGSFEAPGTYTSLIFGDAQFGTLTVSSTSAVPEAGTPALMLAGLGALALGLRRAQKTSQH